MNPHVLDRSQSLLTLRVLIDDMVEIGDVNLARASVADVRFMLKLATYLLHIPVDRLDPGATRIWIDEYQTIYLALAGRFGYRFDLPKPRRFAS